MAPPMRPSSMWVRTRRSIERSSGAARWNALAAYGQVISDGGSEEEATDYVNKFFENVVSLPSSGRDATTAFLGGTGDVLMAYENEAILAAQNDEGFEYVLPDTTLLIENAGAILEDASAPSQAWLGSLVDPPTSLVVGRFA